jgi:hypothetical protein
MKKLTNFLLTLTLTSLPLFSQDSIKYLQQDSMKLLYPDKYVTFLDNNQNNFSFLLRSYDINDDLNP